MVNCFLSGGIFFKIKDVWILVYYLPWIITCGLSIVLDVYSTIQYGTKLLDSTVSIISN